MAEKWDLEPILKEFAERHHTLKPDELFALWFLRAYITDDEDAAKKALTARKAEKGADAVFFDDRNSIVFILQSKFHKKLGLGQEARPEVVSFLTIAERLTGDATEFTDFVRSVEPSAKEKLREARRRILDRKYRLQMYFVTTNRCSKEIRDEARGLHKRLIRHADVRSEVLDASRLRTLLEDYVGGVAPAIHSITLPYERSEHVENSGPYYRDDRRTDIRSWVISVNAKDFAEVFDAYGVRLFARNIRGYLGDTTPVSKSILDTLKEEPQHFWYYNNGITIVCDRAEEPTRSGKLELYNPQIINGQQTVRTIFESASRGRSASVVVRIFVIPRESPAEKARFDELISNIVVATNWQNKIIAPDLVSNDKRQIELEREVRKYGYFYLRKRMKKGEAKRMAGAGRVIIRKEEFAHAIAACDYDSNLIVSVGNMLFEEKWYKKVFASDDARYYLNRYWLMRAVKSEASSFGDGQYGKWLVLSFLWQHLADDVRSRQGSDAFMASWAKRRPSSTPLVGAIRTAFRGVEAYYRARRGTGNEMKSAATFFKESGHPASFSKYWGSNAALRHRHAFETHWRAFAKKLAVE